MIILKDLLDSVINKQNFTNLNYYLDFAERYLSFVYENSFARIISQNENNYYFYQYKEDGYFNITRPINSELMINNINFHTSKGIFLSSLNNIKDIVNDNDKRIIINNMIYTCQQCIGATLDGLPPGQSNAARKLNGDLFELLIRLIFQKIGINVITGEESIPIIINDEIVCTMKYQHDLIIKEEDETIAIGSVKTSSKDRLDKIFIDKFLYNHLTNKNIPHFAIFLNDVQRKINKINGFEHKFGINTTFLAGHFKGFTIKLSPLDGVYYCDLRPNMKTDALLKENIKSLDNLLISDVWKFYPN